MRLVNQSFEIWEQEPGIIGVFKQIERAARLSYKSEENITDDSATEFVNRMVNMGHWATLEHGTVYLVVPQDNPNYHHLLSKYKNNPYSICNHAVTFNGVPAGNLYITSNYRVLLENRWIEDLKYIYSPLNMHSRRVTVHLVCDRGVSHEVVRHRAFSYMQQSTRYVNSSSISPIIEYNCDDISDICAAYQQGFSMKNISDNSSFSEWEIRKILLENNIAIRGLNNKGNRVEDYFSIIDTPEKAYLLGLIQTDGSLSISNRNGSLCITQHKDYTWYIEDMLLDFSDNICVYDDKNCKQLMIGSKTIVNDLINLGIVPNKTRVQTDDNIISLWNSIPDNFKGDFIRGCIDGDGYVRFFIQKRGVNESCNIGFCSIKEILIDKIIDFIYDKFNYKCGKYKCKNLYKLYITDRNKAIEIGDYLYSNFKYPFGHPKKASTWIKRINKQYPIADYKDPKFQIIKPTWINDNSPESIFDFIKSLDCCENSYTKLRMFGWKPQQARNVLPNALKTELAITGFAKDYWGEYWLINKNTNKVDKIIPGKAWKDVDSVPRDIYNVVEKGFFPLRCSKSAHPQMRELAIPLRDEFYELGL